MTKAGTKKREYLVAMTALFCALVASLAMAVAPASAEPPQGETPPVFDGLQSFGTIHGPTDPEDFSWQVQLGQEQVLRQVSETEVEVDYTSGLRSFGIAAEPAHDATGAAVPTTLAMSEGDMITLTVHHRAGNPAAGGQPFAYPIVAGAGWEGGYRTIEVKGPEPEPKPETTPVTPATLPITPPIPTAPVWCTVPALHGLSLRAAKAKLRSADCSIGHVGLAHDATLGKGDVVKQAHSAGTQLAAGASVAVKLGAR